jgi:hypothetical protein
MHRDLFRGPAELRECAMVEIDIGPEALGIAADDGERQRQIVARGADDGFGAAADADPGLGGPPSTGGKMRCFASGGRVRPCQVTVSLRSSVAKRSILSSNRASYCERS